MNSVSIVIPTYGREQVLVDTLSALLPQVGISDELLVVDQTACHELETDRFLRKADSEKRIRWIRHDPPGTVGAMNRGLLEAAGEIVLYLDDDIVPAPDLIAGHRSAHVKHPEAWAVAGRVIQPEDGDRKSEVGSLRSASGKIGGLRTDLDFAFNGTESAWVENVMAGNLSVKRGKALAIGGFDANFLPPVSFRFETEFAKRLVAAGGRIFFEPQASICHLRAGTGGTRSQGSHRTSASPLHSVGDYYYALRWSRGLERTGYVLNRFLRRVLNRFYLAHPWHLPARIVGEMRAMALAFRLYRAGPRLIENAEAGAGVSLRRIILLNTAAPDRPNGSMVRYGRMVRDALEQQGGGKFRVEEIHLAPPEDWLWRFPVPLRTPIRYLCIAANARRRLPEIRDGILHLLDGSHAYLLGAAGAIQAPLVVTVHDLIPLLSLQGRFGPSRPGNIGRWLIRRSAANLAKADVLIAVSANTRADLIRLGGLPPERVQVVPHAMGIADAVLPSRSSSAPPYVLHVAGNNTFYKNRTGVVDVFKIIRRSEPVRLKLAGAPPDAALLRKVADSGAASDIEFVSNVPEEALAALYRNAALLLFPSLYEGFGWPPLEAMAHGCPVVCSDAGSLPEVAGEAALMAPAAEVEALAAQALRILRAADLRQRLVEAGFRHVRRFTPEAMASRLSAAYHAAEAAFSGKTRA